MLLFIGLGLAIILGMASMMFGVLLPYLGIILVIGAVGWLVDYLRAGSSRNR